jgi:LEA14-like dessication related protein
MNRIFSLAALLILAALSTGCSFFVQEPRIALKETNLVGFSSSGIDVEFLIGITNPNSFDLALLGYTYDLRIMAQPMTAGGAQETLLFPSEKETDIRLPIHLKFSNLLEIIKRQPNLDKLPYKLNANLHIKNPLGDMIIPVEKVDTLIVPEKYRPGAAMDRVRNLLHDLR